MTTRPVNFSVGTLSPLDLMRLEPLLCAGLRKFFLFKGHSLHFPLLGADETPPVAAEFLPDEGKLLLPLCRFTAPAASDPGLGAGASTPNQSGSDPDNSGRACSDSGGTIPASGYFGQSGSDPDNSGRGEFLGMFVARGVDESVRKVLPWLPAAASLCLENLILYRRSLLDEASGLFSREHFLRILTAELEKLREVPGERPGRSGTSGDTFRSAAMSDALDSASGVAGDTLSGPAAGFAPGYAAGLVFADAFGGGGLASGGRRFSLMTLHLEGLAEVAREHGYGRADSLLALLARELEACKPGLALAGRSAEDEFCLILPGLGAQACQDLAVELSAALDRVSLTNEVSGRKASVSVSVGYADCPRDLDGLERHTPSEQSRLLLRRARLAALMAGEGRRLAAQTGARWIFSGLGALLNARPAVLSYRGVLAEGGRVLQVAPLSRLQVNLGKNSGAVIGQHFTVWGYVLESSPQRSVSDGPASLVQSGPASLVQSGPVGLAPSGSGSINGFDGAKGPDGKTVTVRSGAAGGPEQESQPGGLSRRYKGEIRLMEVRASDATAELVYCDDPYFPPEPGDQLLLVGPSQTSAPSLEHAYGRAFDPVTGFLSYTDFLPAWCREREKHENSALLLTRFSLLDQDFARPGFTGEFDAWETRWEGLMAFCAEEFRRAFGPDCLYGRYALNSFIVFVPGAALENGNGTLPKLVPAPWPDRLRLKAEALCRRLRKSRLACAVGIAPHPFLDFRKADGPDNAHKALEYALLLPFPQVGLLDTLALNISADRRYSQGDHLGAIGEYKKALLCDENNILAWNSLGVLLAGLGHSTEARRHFEQALHRDPDDPATLYNLGQLCQSIGEQSEAERLYSRCLELIPDGIYPLYRLGQLAEQRGEGDRARELYSRAIDLSADLSAGLSTALSAGRPAHLSSRWAGGQGLARRGLARLDIREGRLEDAREELHEALLANPNDAVALQLLAGLYLDAGEDPRVAESLARQAALLRPDLKAAWLDLARALESSGRADEAREALIRSGEL